MRNNENQKSLKKQGTDAGKTMGRGRLLLLAFLLFYVVTLFWYTIGRRTAAYAEPQDDMFWSYKCWFAGDWNTGVEIMGNIVMFVPLGFLLSAIVEKPWKAALAAAAGALALSPAIEAIQLTLMRGVFDRADLFNNFSGAILGWALYAALRKLTAGRNTRAAVLAIGALFAVVCGTVWIVFGNESDERQNRFAHYFCFQIEEAERENDTLRLSGFAFRYKLEAKDMNLILRSTETGEQAKLTVRYGLPREDVNAYFQCGWDYTDSGFTASGRATPGEEYEVLIQWPGTIAIPTGVYLTGTDIHYAPEKEFSPPDAEGTDLEDIVKQGSLRLYQQDRDCYVYQYQGSLYWIVGPDFSFEEDGTTYLPCRVWTTQPDRMTAPSGKRRDIWDNLSVYFEKNELTGDFGAYRVAARSLDTGYAITVIGTGCYRDGTWVWEKDFRPVYGF